MPTFDRLFRRRRRRVQRALDAGAVEKRPLEDQFYGYRMGMVEDPFGHVWSLGTQIENVSEEEMNRRFAEMMKEKNASD